ncbi:MAG: DUF494 family protein [Ignavibacteriales bacterium]|nr:DUF494 family protein [Ignavibacteriales bacterium]
MNDLDLTEIEAKGYSPSEISTALSYLFEKVTFTDEQGNQAAHSSPHSHRIFHDVEKIAMDAQSRGFLLQLRELNLISDIEFEYIVERIMLSGYTNATLEDVKAIVSSVFFEIKDPLLSGTRSLMLDGDGTIN